MDEVIRQRSNDNENHDAKVVITVLTNDELGGHPPATRAAVRIRILLDLVSYADVRIRSNPFILKRQACTG